MDDNEHMTTPDGGGRRRLVRRVLGLFRPYRAQVALVSVAILLSSGLGVANPLLIRVVFDHALFCQPTLGRLMMGWRESFRPAGMFMKVNQAKGLVDGRFHCFLKTMRGSFKNTDILV